jgi:ankyrin repeat protein
MKNLSLTIMMVAGMATQLFAGAQEDLWTACMQCDLDGVKKSVAAGADLNAMHSSKQNALALSYFCPKVTAYLIEQGVDPMSDGGGALVGACNNYSIEVVKLLLVAGADPNAVSPIYGASAITQTIKQTNCVPCLQMLLEKGADLKKVNDDGTNFAHTLAIFGQTAEQRKTAFAAGKSTMEGYGLKVPDWYGNLGSDRNGTSAEMLDVLIKGSCDINAQDKEAGRTPLMLAIGVVAGTPGKLHVAEALVDKGADVNIITELKLSAVTQASTMDNPTLLKKIIDAGADVKTVGWWYDDKLKIWAKGFTTLSLAAKYGHIENCKILFAAGAKPGKGVHGIMLDPMEDPKDACAVFVRDKSSIYFAIESGNLELVKVFTDNFHFWDNNIMTLKKPTKKDEQDIGGGYVLETTRCKGYKAPIRPGMYAKQLGYKEIEKYLGTVGL